MTNGAWTHDRRTYPAISGFGGGWVGHIETKSWNGGDRPKVVYPKPEKVNVVRRRPTAFKLKRGRMIPTAYEYYVHSFYRKRVGVSRPPKRARDVDHTYVMSLMRLEDEAQTYVYNGTTYGRAVMQWHTVPDSDLNDLSFDDNDQLKLIGKLREKISGSDFNMSVMLGEGHQTLRLIGDSAIRIATALRRLRKGDLAGTARSLLDGTARRPHVPYKQMRPFEPTVDRMSSKWLELQYGWKPLIKDVQGGAEFLAHHLSVPMQQTYRMSVKKEKKVTKPGLDQDLFPGVQCWSHRVIRRSLIVRVTEPPSMMAQLGLLDPEIVAWELVPFSFVVDWFLPIGDWLNARAAVAHVVISTTVQTTLDRRIKGTSAYGSRHQIIGMSRDLGVGTPRIPLPKVKPLSQALSFQHALNGLALLAQAGKGLKIAR
jgi:hypothetical protein